MVKKSTRRKRVKKKKKNLNNYYIDMKQYKKLSKKNILFSDLVNEVMNCDKKTKRTGSQELAMNTLIAYDILVDIKK